MDVESLNIVFRFLPTLIKLGIITEANVAQVKNDLLDEILSASGTNEQFPSTTSP